MPKNIDLYYQAFTHQTFANEKRYTKTYQRLEFLGDALIDAEVSIYLFEKFGNLDEGEMTLIRSACVNKNSFAEFSKQMGLGKLLRTGNGAASLKNNNSILADLFESLSAAIFIDQGRKSLLKLLEKTVFKKINVLSKKELKDAKTLLQELLQTESRESIKYITKVKGSSFVTIVKHDNNIFGEGEGTSKKESEQEAAKNALSKLKGGN